MVDSNPIRTSQPTRKAHGISLLIEQVARLVYDQKHPQAMHPVQWSALRFFARAGGQTRNVAGLATYLGVTSGPASRTAASLLKRKLVSVRPSSTDSRSRIYEITDHGHDTLRGDPIRRVSYLLEELPDAELIILAQTLDKIYSSLNSNGSD